MIDDLDLAPCPFCGGEAYVYALGGGDMAARCLDCCAQGQIEDSDHDAARSWNHRAPKVAGDAEEMARRLEALLVKSEGAYPKLPWRVVPSDGKPIIAGTKHGGNLFRGYIATWAEADLAVAAVNSLPGLIATIRTQAAELAVLKAARPSVQHVDTMNDRVLMEMARDAALNKGGAS